MAEVKSEKSGTSDEVLLETAKKRFQLCVEAEAENRREALKDMEFRVGDQWPDEIRQQRESESRPCLTINRIPQYVRAVANDFRQNRPSIKVSPVGDKSDVESAKIRQGLIRSIEVKSSAEIAYDAAFDAGSSTGRGFFRIIADYVSPGSFDQELLIKQIADRFKAYLDPYFMEPDGSDAEYGFIAEDLSKYDYERTHKKSELCGMSDWLSVGDSSNGWITKDSVRVVEYFYKEYEDVEIVQLSDGSVGPAGELPEVLPEGLTVVNRRTSKVPRVKWALINGVEVLEKRDLPIKWIPLIPILGDVLIVDGKRVESGIIRFARDPQTMYNVWASSEAEAIGLAPKAPWLIAEGQIKGYENLWYTSNTRNHAALPYVPVSIGGVPVPPPSRIFAEANVQAITQARMQSSEDMKAATGIYDSSLGARSNETSGIAIRGRQAQAQTNNYHYVDNAKKSIKHAGRILNEWIPFIYDGARAERIIGDEGEEEIVPLNQEFEKQGERVIHDMSLGEFDISISTGPNFATAREEAFASMIELLGAYPAAGPAIADLLAKNSNFKGSDEVAERLRKIAPPGMIEDKDAKQKPLPPEVQQQMQQLSQMNQQLTEQLNKAMDSIEQKTRELESKERIEFAKLQADAVKTMTTLQSKEAMELMAHQMAQIHKRLGLLDINEPIEDENFEQEPNGAGPSAGFASQEQEQQHSGAMSPDMGI